MKETFGSGLARRSRATLIVDPWAVDGSADRAVRISSTERDTGRKKSPHRVLGTFRWGLVPSWAKDPKVGNRMINARAENVATKPAYRRARVGLGPGVT